METNLARLVGGMMVGCAIFIMYLSSLTLAIESDINCLWTIKSQLKDPNNHLSNWVFGDHDEGSICKFNGVNCWTPGESRVVDINLGGFGLEGKFPIGIKLCSSSQNLCLSGNKLSGNLPPDVFSFNPYLVTLDLSNNSFSGEIPSTLLSENVVLNILLLDHNHFTGQIPSILASHTRLTRFSVAYNNLKGPIPEFTYENLSTSSFSHNSGLCDYPLDPCSMFSIAVITAACAAAICFPVGAVIGWFNVDIGEKQKQRLTRPRMQKPCFSDFGHCT